MTQPVDQSLSAGPELVAAELEPATSGFTLPTGRVRRWLAFALLLSSAPCSTIIFAALGPVLPSLAAEFGKHGNGSFIAQMIMAMPGLGTLFGGLISGVLLEKLGLRRLLLGGLVLYVLAGTAGLYVNEAWELLASRFVLGMIVATHSTCVMVLLSEWVDGGLRAKLLGFTGALSGAVSVTAINLSGALSLAGGWRAPFSIYLLGAVFLVCALLVLTRAYDRVSKRGERAQGSLKPLIPAYLMTFALYLVVMMTAIQVPLLLAAAGIHNPTTRSLMLSFGSIGASSSGFLFGWLIRGLGQRWIMVFSTALTATGFILVGLVSDPRLVGAGCLTFGFGCGMVTPFVGNLILEKAQASVRARAVGLIFVIASVAEFANPILIAPLQAAVGIRGAFLTVGLMVAAASLLAGGRALLGRREQPA